MDIKKNIKGAFNVLAGREGWRATIAGYGSAVDVALCATGVGIAVVGTAGIALPAALAGVWLAGAVLNANSAHRLAKQHRQKKGPTS